MLNLTRDSFLAEMKTLGYEEGKNCLISLQNANGDLPTVNTILASFFTIGWTLCRFHGVRRRPLTRLAIDRLSLRRLQTLHHRCQQV
jgi:hypothetical protein